MDLLDAPPHVPKPSRNRIALRDRILRHGVFGIGSMALVGFFAFLAIYPLAQVVFRLFWVDGAVTLNPIRETLSQDGLGTVLRNTSVIVVLSGFFAVVVGSALAWLNERTDARTGWASEALPLMPFLLPPIAGAVGWMLLLSERSGLLNVVIRDLLAIFGLDIQSGPVNIVSFGGLVFLYTVYMVPYVYLLIASGLRNLDSRLEEQSFVSGASLRYTVTRITIPALAPSLGAAALLVIWFGFSLFSVPVVIGTGAGVEVISVRIVRLLTFTFPPQTSAAVGLSAMVVLIVGSAWLLQRRVLRAGNFATVGGKPAAMKRIPLGRFRVVGRAAVWLYILVAAFLPMAGLLLVALHGFWTPNIDWAGLNLETFSYILVEDGITRTAILNSLRLGVIGATVGILAAGVMSVFVLKARNRRSVGLLDGIIKMPAAVSSLVIAVGFILAFSGPPFNLNGTLLILLLAYLVNYLPQGSVASDAAAGGVSSELTEVADTLGLSRLRTFARISIPLMLPGLVAGWSLLFVRVVGDLTVSAILAGTSNPVVGSRLLELYTSSASFAQVAALATVLTLASALVVFLAMGLQIRLQRRWI